MSNVVNSIKNSNIKNRTIYSLVGRRNAGMMTNTEDYKGIVKRSDNTTIAQLELIKNQLNSMLIKGTCVKEHIFILSNLLSGLERKTTVDYWVINRETKVTKKKLSPLFVGLVTDIHNLKSALISKGYIIKFVKSDKLYSAELIDVYKKSWKCLESIEPKHKEFNTNNSINA